MRPSIARWILLLAASGCGTETGNGLDSVALALEGEAVGAALGGRDRDDKFLSITSASARVRHVELMLPGGVSCAEPLDAPAGVAIHCDGAKLRLEGPFRVDLLTGASEPPLTGLTLPELNLKRVDVRLDPGREAASLVVAGAIEGGAPYEAAFDFNDDARFESATGASLAAATADRLLLLLDVRRWFADIPLEACAAAGDLAQDGGKIRLDRPGRSACAMVENTLRAAIRGSGRLDRGP